MINTAKNGQTVVVKTEKGFKIGQVLESKRGKSRKYYTIQMENGHIYKLVPFNKPDSVVYIDGKLSKKYINS